jgi:two-component system OmpR family sensor kinase
MRLSRRLHGQLRFRVLAGVVALTLLTLAAFDVVAVATMRHYLVNRTDGNLHAALETTVVEMPVIENWLKVAKAEGRPLSELEATYPAGIVAAAGEYDISYVPRHGEQIVLQRAAPAFVGYPVSIISLNKADGRMGTVTTGRAAASLIAYRWLALPVSGGALVASTSLDQVNATVGQVQFIVTLGSIGAVLFIGLGVFIVLRRGLRPVEAMAGQADRITAGDLTHRVEPHNPASEVGRLGTALNGMLTRIEAGVQELEDGQEVMRRFFADASHELRSPLASLRANAELYLQGALPERTQVDEVMWRIALETKRMGRLVDDMLRLARLDQQPVREQEPVDLTALVEAAVERAVTADPGRTWQAVISDDLVIVGDAELLRSAVDNLIANVHVHTPPGTTGTITVDADDDGLITITVSDDGPGVPPDKLHRVFDRFYRADAASSRPGSGLGLAIASEVAAAHDGTARATASYPHGLSVTLSLPARPLVNATRATAGISVT